MRASNRRGIGGRPGFAAFGMRAFTTTRQVGSFGTASDEPVRVVMNRWSALREELRHWRLAPRDREPGPRVDDPGPSARMVGLAARRAGRRAPIGRSRDRARRHGRRLRAGVHRASGRRRSRCFTRGGAAPRRESSSGQSTLLDARGFPADELLIHTGPAICGACYEVSGDVYAQLTGTNPGRPTTIDLRALIAEHARARGVRQITTSASCTRCNNDRFFSHRAGDAGRQLGVMISDLES